MESLYLTLTNYTWFLSIVLVIIFLSKNWKHSFLRVAVAVVIMHLLLIRSVVEMSSFGVFVYCFLIPHAINSYRQFISSKNPKPNS